MDCRNCGDPIDARRVELGYDYCLKKKCQDRCLIPVVLAAVGVNKAADYYMKAEEVVPSPPPAAMMAIEEDSESDGDGVTPGRPARRRRPAAAPADPPRRIKTTGERLEEAGRALDVAIQRAYERFCRAEITARELDRERERLTRAFNGRVMAENIRYRSLLRPVSQSR